MFDYLNSDNKNRAPRALEVAIRARAREKELALFKAQLNAEYAHESRRRRQSLMSRIVSLLAIGR